MVSQFSWGRGWHTNSPIGAWGRSHIPDSSMCVSLSSKGSQRAPRHFLKRYNNSSVRRSTLLRYIVCQCDFLPRAALGCPSTTFGGPRLRGAPLRLSAPSSTLASSSLPCGPAGRSGGTSSPYTRPHPGEETELDLLKLYDAPYYKDSGKLEGMVALITGGDSGIGRSVTAGDANADLPSAHS